MKKDKGKAISKKKENKISEKNIISQDVFFSKISFSFNKLEAMKNVKDGYAQLPIKIGLKWKIVATRNDSRGVLLGCDFSLQSTGLKIDIFIETEMIFDEAIDKKQLLNTCFFQVLASNLFFPYLAELIATNTEKLDPGSTPLILDNVWLSEIIAITKKQGTFNKSI